jgi:hypothetical protein
MTTDEAQLKLIDVFGKVAGLLGKLPGDAERKRVVAAIICLFDDDHTVACEVVKAYAVKR